MLVVIGFCFGCLLEGIAGFGTPVAITSALLILVGFPPLEALTFTLIFNTAPVAFGALGAPVTVLGRSPACRRCKLGAMIGRQLPFIALLLPFYVMALYGGARSVQALWPVLLVAGGSFAAGQFVSSNYLDYALTDVLSSLDLADRDAAVPAGLEAGADPAFADRAAERDRRGAATARGAGLAGLAALDRRLGGRDRLDPLQDLRHRPAGDPLAGPAQGSLHHPLRQALCGGLGLPAAGHRHRDPGVGDHHRGLVGVGPGAFRRLLSATPGGRAGSRS